MSTIAILQDNLLIITGLRPEVAHHMRTVLDENGYTDVHALFFTDDMDVLDLRDAPPEVSKAAMLVDEWLNHPEARNDPPSHSEA